MKRRAVYAGTFDPITKGHEFMIEQAAALFDEVIVAIGINPDKNPMFTVEERLEMVKALTNHLPNVRTTSFDNQLLIKFATAAKASFIVRGIRDIKDYDYEKTMRHINADINSDVTSVFLMPPREIAEVSSSTVKGLMGPEGWAHLVAKYVSKPVLKRLIQKKYAFVWQELLALGAEGSETKFWDAILDPYLDDKRFYHNPGHICDLLHLYEKIKDKIQDKATYLLALVTHDIDKTEAASAQFVKKLVSELGLPKSVSDRAAQVIGYSKTHLAAKTDSDALYFLDSDLAILGRPENEFDEYELQVRQEYQHVPEKDFRRIRAGILRKFLDKELRPHVYLTKYFRDSYETQARKNLERSIKNLQSDLRNFDEDEPSMASVKDDRP